MASAGAVYVSILPDAKGFAGALKAQLGGPVSKVASDLGTQIGKNLTLGKTAAIGAFGAIGAAAFKGLGVAVDKTVELAGEVRKLSTQLGISTEDASRLIAMGKELGLTTDQLSTGFGIFEKHLVDGGAAFEKYGISLTDANGNQKSFNEVLGEAADKYVELGPGIEGTAFAMDVFGRSGKSLIPILKQGSEGIAAMSQEADDLGVVMSEKDVAAARALAIQQRTLNEAFTGLAVSVGTALLPVLKTMTSFITEGVKLFREIPGPIKTAITVIVALGATFTALGLVIGVVRKALLGYGIQLGTTTTETIAATAATTDLAAAQTAAGVSAGGLLGKLKGLLPLIPLVTFNVQQLGTEGGKNAKFFDGWVRSVKDGSLTLGQLRSNLIQAAGSEAKFREQNGMTVDAMVQLVAKEAGVVTQTKRVGAAADDTAAQLARLKNLAVQTAGSVTNAWARMINTTDNFSSSVRGLHQQIVALPSGKVVTITLPDINKQIEAVNRLHGAVVAVAGTYGITFRIQTIGHPPPVGGAGGAGRVAEGGVFRAARGFEFVGPGRVGRFIAGEASYPTPLGTGAEVVTNRGVEPLSADHLSKIADFIAARMYSQSRGSGGAPREITLRAKGRDLVGVINAQELWTR